MTSDLHDVFTRQVLWNTIGTCMLIIWFFPLDPRLWFPALLILAFAGSLQIFRLARQRRIAKQRYEQIIMDHLEAGGMVMLARQGKRWVIAPIPWPHAEDLKADIIGQADCKYPIPD